MSSLTFLGGAQTVTGSKFLLGSGGLRVLVDCGLFQGLKDLRLRNWAPLPFDAQSLDCVILTHAHLDHTGYFPILVRNGFKGKAFCTPPTTVLTNLLLMDAGRIQEREAARALEGGYSKHNPPAPLFTQAEAVTAIRHLQSVPGGKWHSLTKTFRFRFLGSGHILGSAFIELDTPDGRIVFSGDLGRTKPLLLPPPALITKADYLVLESTYGDRRHPKEPVLRALGRIVNEALDRGGDVLIPSFAVGRAQDVLHLLGQLKRQKTIPDVPVFLNSPLGIEATQALGNFPDWHRLNPSEANALSRTATWVEDAKFSQSLLRNRKHKIIIAGSGMVTGGRILDHLEKALPDPRHTVLLVGYQAAGTRGRLLRDGVPEVKIYGRFVQVKARIEEISGLSAHADQVEIMNWLRGFKTKPRTTFLVHGEPQPCDALRVKIEHSLGWHCHMPHPGEKVAIK